MSRAERQYLSLPVIDADHWTHLVQELRATQTRGGWKEERDDDDTSLAATASAVDILRLDGSPINLAHLRLAAAYAIGALFEETEEPGQNSVRAVSAGLVILLRLHVASDLRDYSLAMQTGLSWLTSARIPGLNGWGLQPKKNGLLLPTTSALGALRASRAYVQDLLEASEWIVTQRSADGPWWPSGTDNVRMDCAYTAAVVSTLAKGPAQFHAAAEAGAGWLLENVDAWQDTITLALKSNRRHDGFPVFASCPEAILQPTICANLDQRLLPALQQLPKLWHASELWPEGEHRRLTYSGWVPKGRTASVASMTANRLVARIDALLRVPRYRCACPDTQQVAHTVLGQDGEEQLRAVLVSARRELKYHRAGCSDDAVCECNYDGVKLTPAEVKFLEIVANQDPDAPLPVGVVKDGRRTWNAVSLEAIRATMRGICQTDPNKEPPNKESLEKTVRRMNPKIEASGPTLLAKAHGHVWLTMPMEQRDQ